MEADWRHMPHIALFGSMPEMAWLLDSRTWMSVAIQQLNASDQAEEGGMVLSALNVASVCAGLAFELVLKAFVATEGRTPQVTHSARVTYKELSRESQAAIARSVERHMALPIDAFLQYLDDYMTDKDRKYSMVDTSGTPCPLYFVDPPSMQIPKLAHVHADIVGFVARRVKG